MHIEFQVEEESAEAALKILLPRLVGDRASFKILNYRGKQRLLRELPRRLHGYATRMTSETRLRLVVLLDADRDDCSELKNKLEGAARKAGLTTKSSPDPQGRFKVVNRLAVEELEAWFFGDVSALRTAFPRLPATLEQKAPLRDPDAIRGGTYEMLKRELRNVGHCGSYLPKIQTAREVAAHMNVDPSVNRSRSFRTFCTGISALIEQGA